MNLNIHVLNVCSIVCFQKHKEIVNNHEIIVKNQQPPSQQNVNNNNNINTTNTIKKDDIIIINENEEEEDEEEEEDYDNNDDEIENEDSPMNILEFEDEDESLSGNEDNEETTATTTTTTTTATTTTTTAAVIKTTTIKPVEKISKFTDSLSYFKKVSDEQFQMLDNSKYISSVINHKKLQQLILEVDQQPTDIDRIQLLLKYRKKIPEFNEFILKVLATIGNLDSLNIDEDGNIIKK